MDETQLRKLLRQLAAGKTTVKEALEQLKHLPFADIGFSRLDTHRALRTGFSEVIFCPGKSPEQVIRILKRLKPLNQLVIATRAEPDLYEMVKAALPAARYYPAARIIAVGRPHTLKGKRYIMVVSAGTSDMPVAEEAAVTAELLGSRIERLYDVGVAGIHRLFQDMKRLQYAAVVIVVAGMEGALASVVGGLVSKPVIAVPTSVGYGANFRGLAALLTMLNSCAPGVCVVNIDNGFGAGFLAHRILVGQTRRSDS